MSYDDYVQYIAQKYKLAVTIAVIQSKPDNMSLEEHIQELKNNVQEETDSDLNISINSDDFQIDNDEFEQDFNENDIISHNNEVTQETEDKFMNNRGNTIPNVQSHNTSNSDVVSVNTEQCDYKLYHNKNDRLNEALNTQHLKDYNKISRDICEHNQNYSLDEACDRDMINTQDVNNSITILPSSIEAEEAMIKMILATERKSSLDEVLTLLKDIDNNMGPSDDTITPTGCNRLQTQACDQLEDKQCVDDDETLCDFNNLPYVDMNSYSNGQNTNVKETNLRKDEKMKKKMPPTDLNDQAFVNFEGEECSVANHLCKQTTDVSCAIKNTKPDKLSNNINEIKVLQNKLHSNTPEAKAHSPLRQYRSTKEFRNIYQNVAGLFGCNINNQDDSQTLNTDRIKTIENVNNTPEKKHQTFIHISQDEFTCNTHYSESQVNEVIQIDNKYIHGTTKTSSRKNQDMLDHCQNIEENDSLHQEEVLQNNNIFQSDYTSANNSQMYDTINKNISVLDFNNQKGQESNEPHNKRKIVTSIENNEQTKLVNDSIDNVQIIKHENYSKRKKAIHIDDTGFTQESQLTLYATSRTESSSFVNNKLNIDKNVKNCDTKNIFFSNNDFFSQQSQLANHHTSQTNNETEVSLKYAQDGLLHTKVNDFHKNDTNFYDSLNVYNKTQLMSQKRSAMKENTSCIQRNMSPSIVNNNLDCIQASNDPVNNSKESTNNDKYLDDQNETKTSKASGKSNCTKHLPQQSNSEITSMSKYQNIVQNKPSSQSVDRTAAEFSKTKDKSNNEEQGVGYHFNETENFKDTMNIYNNTKDVTQNNSFLPKNIHNQPCTYDEQTDYRSEQSDIITNNERVEMEEETKRTAAYFEKDKKVTKMSSDVLNASKGFDNIDDNLDIMEIEEQSAHSQAEVIPFKVIEELNKVKKYLNRDVKCTDGFSSDAGYRSESGSRRSGKSASQTTLRFSLNQSAYSLLNYITQSKLALNTQDITDEISEVLGQLIDKLHEDEIYPSFLEETLDTVKLILGNVCEENCGPNSLTKKDETIHRIVLLNKSVHIQKYTIDKITQILENIHTDLSTNETSYDIENIDKLENLCYLFHVLEILLKVYKKTIQNSSQSTQNTQSSKNTQNLSQNTQEDARLLKRSSISDIWRKKWNSNYKEIANETQERTCPISKCSSVLNKLVVGCMENYSLVSFYALQCFNVMQN